MQGHAVTKLHMLRLSSTWNCYQLLFNTQMEWSEHYLILIREGTKHLTVECHLTSLPLVQCTQPYSPIPVYQIFFFFPRTINLQAKFQIHFTNRPRKDRALLSPLNSVVPSDGEIEATWICFIWHCLHQWDRHQAYSEPRKFSAHKQWHTPKLLPSSSV